MFEKPVVWNGGQLTAEWGNRSATPPPIWQKNNFTPEVWDSSLSLPADWRSKSSGGSIEKWSVSRVLPDEWGKAVPVAKSEDSGSSESVRSGDTANAINAVKLKAGNIASGVFAVAKSTANRAAEYARSDEAAAKINAAKNKAKSLASDAGSILSGIKNKATDKISERKNMVRSSDENIPTADEYDAEDNYDVSYNETAYQNVDEYAPDPIADKTSFEDVTDEYEPQLTEIDNTIQYQETTADPYQSNNASFPDNSQYQNFQQPQSPVLPQSSTPSYVIQKQKTNPILIIVIIVLVLVVGVLGGVLFMMSRDNKSDDSGNSIPASNVEKTTDSEEIPTESETKTTTAAATTPVESTTQTTNSIPDQYTSDEISAMFSAYIAENPDPNRTYDNSDYGYALIDLNSDGTQELLISSGENDEGIPMLQAVYAINNGKLNQLWISDLRTYGQLCKDNYIYASYIYGQGHGIFIYKYSSGGRLEEVESIEYNASTGRDKALHNGREVSQSEAEKILAKYNAKKFKTKQLKFEEKTPEVTEPDTSTLNNTELGRMYNEFYIYSLHGYISGGYIEDYNGDGVDDLVFWAANAGYVVAYYKNGAIETNVIPNTDSYGYDEPLFGMKTQHYAWDELPDKCREKAVSCGFTINKDFYLGATSLIGYVKTNEIDGTLNLRSAPSTDSDVLVQLPNGKLFNVIPESTGNYGVYDDSGWYYISVNQNGNNYMGYISSDYAVAWDNAI